MRVLPVGDRAVLAEFDTLGETMAAARSWSDSPAPGVVDVVPAARTVLVRFDPGATTAAAMRAWLAAPRAAASDLAEPRSVTIGVRYDGPDLAEAARAVGVSPERLVGLHTAASWTSAFIGFAPGFAYLSGWHHALPRRDTSRPAVPAGSVGLAAEYSGVYPRESPGGWQLIGTAEAELWNPDATPPALLAPGTRVRFVEVR